jgi:hypothetical protein
MITLDRLVFDPANTAGGASVGAYLRDSAGALLTSTLIGADQALDVNLVGASGLGIFAEDSAHVSGDLGQQILAVRNDAGTSLVSADGDYSPLSLDANGNLRVLATVSMSGVYAEDSAHVSADIGMYNLSVREDTLASSTSASGDYQSYKTDALGRLWVNRSAQSAAYGAVSVTTTATDIVGTDLTNRTRIIIQNASNRDVFIGHNASVTTANGIRLSAGGSIEVEAGPALNWHGITAASTADVRYLEVA